MGMVREPRTFEYGEIRAMQERRPDITIYVAAEPVTLATACLECRGTGKQTVFDHYVSFRDVVTACPSCREGYRITENGEALRKLMSL